MQEEKPFLDSSRRGPSPSSSQSDYRPSYSDDEPVSRRSQQKQHGSSWRWLALHISLITIYTLVFLRAIQKQTQTQTPQTQPAENAVPLPFSPANDVLEYHLVEMSHSHHHGANPYIGEPRLEMDEAWSALMRPTVIRVTDDQMVKANKTSIGVKNGGGWVGNLEVYHQLHCLKRMKQYHHPDYYFPNMTDAERDHLFGHFDHCLEVLRQGVLCRADTFLNTFEWEDAEQTKPATIAMGQRRCVNWDKLHAWATEHALERDPKIFQFGEVGAQGPLLSQHQHV